MSRINRLLLAVCYMVMNIAGRIACFFHKKKGPVWLISERGTDARDNGYRFFLYMNRNHPEINTYYVITEDSYDFPKISAEGRYIKPGSLKHHRLLYEADALISTHAFGYTPDMVIYSHLARHGLFRPKGISVFLQHGVSDKNAEWLHRRNFKPDVFVVSTFPEEKLVREMYEQPESVIAFTGMCRFDSLTDMSNPEKRIVLFMPTWRQWLSGCSEKSFASSEYFIRIQRFLENQELGKILKENHAELLFYPHVEMQKYIYCFKGNENVEILDASNSDVQLLLRTANVLITDYSSVFFDFIYMKKPVLFYQWDKKKFCGEHYKGVTTDYESIGFTSTEEDQTVENLRRYFAGEVKQTENIFKYHDRNNCRRVFETIKKKTDK